MLAPLVKLEADHDRRVREAQAREDVSVRWDRGLSKRHIAIFSLARGNSYASYESNELRLAVGDELKIRLNSGGARQHGKPWEASGHVLRLADGEIALELRTSNAPTEVTECGFVVDFVWKGTSYDRMQNAVPKPNLQPDFNVSVCECFDTSPSAGLRELDESDRSVQKSAESTSI